MDNERAWRAEWFHRLLIKPVAGEDGYIGWSGILESPTWAGTGADAAAQGCPAEWLERADEHGSNSQVGEYWWDWGSLIAGQRGNLPRSRLMAYAAAYLAGRADEAYALLEPFEETAGDR